jgi:hypothetical protein
MNVARLVSSPNPLKHVFINVSKLMPLKDVITLKIDRIKYHNGTMSKDEQLEFLDLLADEVEYLEDKIDRLEAELQESLEHVNTETLDVIE